MANKLDILTIKDYSTNLESLSTDKLKKLLHIAVDGNIRYSLYSNKIMYYVANPLAG